MCNFKFLDIFILIQVFPDPGARKHPMWFDNMLLTKFLMVTELFLNFLMSQILAIFDKTCFFNFFWFLFVF